MNIVEYIKETKAEMKHVSWPTRRQSLTHAVVVIVISVGAGVALGLFDSVYQNLLQLFI
jgi:preprotein translocase subunit SecE